MTMYRTGMENKIQQTDQVREQQSFLFLHVMLAWNMGKYVALVLISHLN